MFSFHTSLKLQASPFIELMYRYWASSLKKLWDFNVSTSCTRTRMCHGSKVSNIKKFHHYLWNWLRNFIIICGINWEISLFSVESIEKFYLYPWHPITGWPLLLSNSFLQMSLLQRRTMHCGTKKRNLSWQMCQR